jgi:hypothetical protein
LPAFLQARGAYGSNPAASLTAEVGQPEQLLSLRLYHQGLARMRQEKVIDGTAELVSFVVHPLNHLLWTRLSSIWCKPFLKGASKPIY